MHIDHNQLVWVKWQSPQTAANEEMQYVADPHYPFQYVTQSWADMENTKAGWGQWNVEYYDNLMNQHVRFAASRGVPDGLPCLGQPDAHLCLCSKHRASRAEAAELKRKEARQKAEQLLMAVLTPAQRQQYADCGYFETEVNDRRYRITNHTYSANVYLVGKDGKVARRYCCHIGDGNVPLHDHLLAQKVMLELNEPEFLRLANVHPV